MNKSSFYDTFRRSNSIAGAPGDAPPQRRNKIAGLLGVAVDRASNNVGRTAASGGGGNLQKPLKAQRLNTAQPDDIAKKLFLSLDITIQPMEYAVLWNSVSPARFITRCIKFLLDYEKSPEEMGKTMKKSPEELRYFVTCVLHSITVFDLFSVMVSSQKSLLAVIIFKGFRRRWLNDKI